MSQKIGRNYSLTISGDNFFEPIVITLPFTIEFDITRTLLTSSNLCQIRLYNLSPTLRNQLRRSVTTGWSYPIETIVLRAGYLGNPGFISSNANINGTNFGTQCPVIFSGNVNEAWSYREGINFITQMECYDGGFTFANSQITPGLATFPKLTPYSVIISSMISSLPEITLGAVGNYPGVTPRSTTYTGNTIDHLNILTGGGFFIDKGVGNALGNNEYSLEVGPPTVIDASTGLLNTPVLENALLTYEMIFEPNLNIGTAVTINSRTLEKSVTSNFSGQYKTASIKHRGMISQTVCGDCVTTGTFFYLQTPTAVVSNG